MYIRYRLIFRFFEEVKSIFSGEYRLVVVFFDGIIVKACVGEC